MDTKQQGTRFQASGFRMDPESPNNQPRDSLLSAGLVSAPLTPAKESSEFRGGSPLGASNIQRREGCAPAGLAGAPSAPAKGAHPSRSAQAMIEVMVGLVALIVLIAGLLQVASLTRARTDAMVAARDEAGGLAMLDAPISELPDYIYQIDAGPDGRTYSYDDETSTANPAAFDAVIVDQAVSEADEWEVLEALPTSPFADLHGSLAPAGAFGLLKGDASETVTLLPAVRSLLYRADEIDVECDVWMTWTRGIY